jgi:hypothetical protein
MVIPECSPASAARTQNSERPRRQHAYNRSRNSDGSDSSLWFWFLHDRLGRMVLQIPKTTRHLPLTRQEQLISRPTGWGLIEIPPEPSSPPKPVNPQTETTPFPPATYPCPTSTPQPATIEVDQKKQKPRTTPGALPIWNEYFAGTTAPSLSKISTLHPNTNPGTNLSRKE